jgi:DNA-binding response OmpR family regulator
VVDAGADMHQAKPASVDQVVVAIPAVHRRVASYSGSSGEWLLDRQAGRLIAPDGVRIDLSDLDLAVMERFVQAEGQAVTRESLCHHLGRPVTEEPDNTLSAIIYRLRRRIERATASPVPLQALSRVGYVFRGPLRSA